MGVPDLYFSQTLRCYWEEKNYEFWISLHKTMVGSALWHVWNWNCKHNEPSECYQTNVQAKWKSQNYIENNNVHSFLLAFNLVWLEKCYILYFLVPLVFNYTSCHKKQWESRVREEGGKRGGERGNSNLGFRFSGNFYSQKAAVNDTRAVLKAKQINTLQDEDEIPRAIISG